MDDGRRRVHPYIPNAVPDVRAAMLAAIGASSVEELYADIPESLRLRRPLDLPAALGSEAELVRHVEGLLARNTSTREALSFLGAGCYNHHVPAVCDEINGRGEFLTAYAGDPYEDHGRFQALWEYESLMGELLERDVVNVPTYDGFQAAGTAIRMAARITGRRRALVAASVSADKRSKVADYVRPDVDLELVPFDAATGTLDLAALEAALGPDVACVFVENPTFLGTVETGGPEIVRLAHAAGALAVVSVDPVDPGGARPAVRLGRRHRLRRHPAAGDPHADGRRPRRVHRERRRPDAWSWSTPRACSGSRPRPCPASTASGTSPTSGPRSPCARRARSGSARPPPCGGSPPASTSR